MKRVQKMKMFCGAFFLLVTAHFLFSAPAPSGSGPLTCIFLLALSGIVGAFAFLLTKDEP